MTTPLLLYLPHLLPIYLTTKLIIFNPFFLQFPAALPIMFVAECNIDVHILMRNLNFNKANKV